MEGKGGLAESRFGKQIKLQNILFLFTFLYFMKSKVPLFSFSYFFLPPFIFIFFCCNNIRNELLE